MVCHKTLLFVLTYQRSINSRMSFLFLKTFYLFFFPSHEIIISPNRFFFNNFFSSILMSSFMTFMIPSSLYSPANTRGFSLANSPVLNDLSDVMKCLALLDSLYFTTLEELTKSQQIKWLFQDTEKGILYSF